MPLNPPRVLIAVAVSLLVTPAPVDAQWRTDPVQPAALEAAAVRPQAAHVPGALRTATGSVGTLALSGVAGAAVGGVGAALLGYHLDRHRFRWDCGGGCEDPGAWGLLGGWFLGAAIATPLGVHLANDRRGSLPTAYLSSSLIAAAGVAGLLISGAPEGAVVLVSVPAAQVISAVLIERGSAP